jgi:hypothetical protein
MAKRHHCGGEAAAARRLASHETANRVSAARSKASIKRRRRPRPKQTRISPAHLRKQGPHYPQPADSRAWRPLTRLDTGADASLLPFINAIEGRFGPDVKRFAIGGHGGQHRLSQRRARDLLVRGRGAKDCEVSLLAGDVHQISSQ